MTKIGYLFMIITSVFIFTYCKMDVEEDSITISITGDEHITVKRDMIDVKRGEKWRKVKVKVLNCVECERGYLVSSQTIGSKENNEKILASYVFEENTNIYITSKLKRKKNEGKITIQIKGDTHIEINNDKMIVKKGCTWIDIKEGINDRIKLQEGYQLNKWKTGSSSRGRTLQDEHIFKRNCSIYAVSKKNKE